ncbi:MAG: outer membrane lipoprotein LolB [Burkholderiaceae bacterium]|nr:outer membrane lipoprotein LolB [Burkholderiaceae bacterium]
MSAATTTRRVAVLAALAAVLAGCATGVPSPGAADLIAGRLALQVDAYGQQPARSLGALFELRGDAAQGAFGLYTPLGTTLAQARWRPGDVELVTADGTYRFDTLDAMTQRMLGEPLPLAALFDWLRARPWPGAASAANAVGFEQLGWSVDLSRHVDGAVLLRRPQPPAVTLRVQLDAAS